MLTALTLALVALSAPVAPPSDPAPSELIARWVRGTDADRPRINVWLNRDDVYNRGDQARVYFKSDRDAYVTIVRIDTDGRMRVLFPIDPWEDNFARGGKTFEVLGRDRDEAFRIDDYPGVGYVFAIAAEDPFNYDDIIRGDHWDYHTISDGRVRGDPYVTVSDIADRISQEGDYDYDVSQYYVEKRYDYPRFVCYDCHTYTSWRAWDPYSSYCSRFRIVVYNDWYYYPYRYYNGGGVIVRPYRPGPRYVFKDADPRNDYITRVAERPRGDSDGRRSGIERDRTSADIGGRGAIPAPVSPRRRAPEGSDRGGVNPERRRTQENRQPAPDGRGTPDDGGRSEPNRRNAPDRTREPGNTREVPSTGNSDSPRRNAPDRTPEPGTTREVPSSGSSDSPRRNAPDRTREPGNTREVPSSGNNDSPRRTDPDRSRDPGNTREVPSNGGYNSPRQRSSDDRPEQSARPNDAQPQREPSRREPSGDPARQAPPERPRAEPRQAPPPRSTGEPQLRRRRP